MKRKFGGIIVVLALSLMASYAVCQADSFYDALKDGKVTLLERLRYEYVDQDGLDENAKALTLKSVLGYETGSFYNFSVRLEFENTTSIGNEDYNDTINGKTEYPVVADPEHSEVNQVYVNFTGLKKTSIKLGRQRIILDNARFIGNVGWRQNEQTFDGISLKTTAIPHVTMFYAYIQNVNRIFSDNHPTKSDTRMDTHLFNVRYSGADWLHVTGYAYLFDYDYAPESAMKTLGIRIDGKIKVSDTFKILYVGEYANQSDYADGSDIIDADYFRGELGAVIRFITIKTGYELLGGDGSYGFSTPLATLHAFNGWADKFLSTPADGLEDLFFEASLGMKGFKFKTVYHMFSSDENGYDYGDELDMVLTKSFAKHYLLGVKYAGYYADDNDDNTGGLANDTTKFWVFFQLKI